MGHTGPILEGRGNSDYERYVRVPELLELQKEISRLSHPEERLFQTMHQTAELWLHHVDYEINRATELLRAEEFAQTTDLLRRCTMILDLLREQIVILETMAPADYHVIRTSSLGRGSGQESPGFQRLLDVDRRLWPSFQAALEKRNLTPLDVQRQPRRYGDLFRLVEAMMDYDSAFMKWRYTHLRLAVRVIGSRVKSLKGVPVTQLEQGTRETLFPVLWEAISDLTEEFKPDY
jgi:tryptophan 2,3-dioxygenase